MNELDKLKEIEKYLDEMLKEYEKYKKNIFAKRNEYFEAKIDLAKQIRKML